MGLSGAPTLWRLFELPFGPWMRSRVRVHVTGVPERAPRPERPLLLCANHESFWDGFLLREVQRRVRPDAAYRAVMLRDELDRRPWLAALGAVGVKPGSVASTRTLLRTLETLASDAPTSVVGFFPQGVLRPGDPRPLAFRRGVAAVADALSPATLLPVGIRLVPGTTPRTEAFLSLGEPVPIAQGARPSVADIERAVADELDAIQAWIEGKGEGAADHWPGPTAGLPRARGAYAHQGGVEPWISRN